MRKIIWVLLPVALMMNAACPAEDSFLVSSEEVNEGQVINQEQVYDGFGCTGSNVSPSLRWSGAPAETRSFAVTMFDPDAPTGHGWWHWLIFNIPADVVKLEKGAGSHKSSHLPAGSIQSRTDFGKTGYGGPCPPAGDQPHNYVITVYAIKIDKLPVDEHSKATEVISEIRKNTLGKAVLKATYAR